MDLLVGHPFVNIYKLGFLQFVVLVHGGTFFHMFGSCGFLCDVHLSGFLWAIRCVVFDVYVGCGGWIVVGGSFVC